MVGHEDAASQEPNVGGNFYRWGTTIPPADEALCLHEVTRTDRAHHGSFIVLSDFCVRCGKLLGEETVLALVHMRCPVDPRLDRCRLSCPVEDGSILVFEKPCEPVRLALEDSGFVAITPANPSEREPARE